MTHQQGFLDLHHPSLRTPLVTLVTLATRVTLVTLIALATLATLATLGTLGTKRRNSSLLLLYSRYRSSKVHEP